MAAPIRSFDAASRRSAAMISGLRRSTSIGCWSPGIAGIDGTSLAASSSRAYVPGWAPISTAIQLFLEREAEHGHDSAGLFQNCFSLSDLPLGSGAGVIAITHQLDEVLVCRNLVLGNCEPGLIAANL